jgi:hypothetical protein
MDCCTAAGRAILGVVVVAMALAAVPETAVAKGKKGGSLYVHRYYDAAELKQMGAAYGSEVYVYQADGTIVHSGHGNGSYAPGERIDVPVGDYLVEVGRARTRHNLRRFTVKKGSVTEVPTGWVAVTSWAPEDQPKDGCQSWDAEIRAYVVDGNGKEHLVAHNRGRPGATTGRIQLAAGPTYRVYWHGLAVEMQVKAGAVTYLNTGVAGPVLGGDARLAADKSDAAGVPHVLLCKDGPTQVLAGTWWLAQIEKSESYPYEKLAWTEEETISLDENQARDLRADKFPGRAYRGPGSEGAMLAAEEVMKLNGYKEGALKKRAGGKFNLGSDGF